MHELAIAESVVSSVLGRTGARHVTVVRLRVGGLAGVMPDALTFCFELAAAGTPLEGAVLEIVHEAGRAVCRSCESEFEPRDAIMLCDCGSADVRLVAGRDLAVASVDLAPEVA